MDRRDRSCLLVDNAVLAVSTLDAVAEILREVAPRALKAREIAELAVGRLPTASRTPETVVSRDLAIDVRDHGVSSRFLRVDRGAFVLKEALPTALYCDIDSFANAWTRNLIAAGEIAPGVVDERSIRDLKPVDIGTYRQFHACNGIGVWSRALRDAGWADEWPIWTGSLPCQPWSSAGRRGGESDERHLWPEWFRLIRACGPGIVVGEQVASKDGYRWLDLVAGDFGSIGYHFTATELSAAAVGAPHRRQRIYFVAFLGGRRFPCTSRRGIEASASGSGIDTLHARVEDEAHPGGTRGDGDRVDFETQGSAYTVAYAREGGCTILGTTRVHDRGQPGDDVARCSATHRGGPGAVSDAAIARPCLPQDHGADRGDAGTGTEAIEGRSAGNLEPERGRDVDEASPVSNAERFVRDAGRERGAHGRPEVESDRHSEVDGTFNGSVELGDAGRSRSQGGISGAPGRTGTVRAGEVDDVGCSCVRPVELGDACLARGGRDAGEVPGAEASREGERIEARDLADELVASGADDGTLSSIVDGSFAGVAMVRGAAGASGDAAAREDGFIPGYRIRLADPSWGGAVGGFWAQDVEWIYCRPEPGHQDGRWRPAESGTLALVAGPAPGVGRTRAKRLRGYGNAIVRPLATAFISAVIDTLVDARSASEDDVK